MLVSWLSLGWELGQLFTFFDFDRTEFLHRPVFQNVFLAVQANVKPYEIPQATAVRPTAYLLCFKDD